MGEAGDIDNSTRMPNNCDGPYHDLGVCVNKESSAWTEVWLRRNRERKSITSTAPEDRDLGMFLSFWAG